MVVFFVAPRGRLLPHLRACNYKIDLLPSKLKRRQIHFQAVSRIHLTLKHERPPGKQVTAREKKHPSTTMTYQLEKSSTCCEPRSRLLFRDYLLKLIQPSDCYYSAVLPCGHKLNCWGNIYNIRSDYRAPGAVVKGID